MNARVLNRVGGIPDLVLKAIPNFVSRRNPLGRAEYLRLLESYDPERWIGNIESFLRIPDDAPASESALTGNDEGRRFEVIRYPSRYAPRNEYAKGRFRAFKRDQDGYVLLWRHSASEARPLVLCIHGFQMGRPARAKRLFKIRKLLDLGVDVALYVLPFHWRREEREERHFFLNPNDIPLTIESFAQNLHDLHSAVLLLRGMGYRKVGAIGASLGGYTAALYATQPAALDFIFAAVPAIDLWDFLKPNPREFRFEIDDAIVRATRTALKIVSPLQYEPAFDVGRICVVLHGGDRICRPEHTRAWVEKWRIRNVVEVAGGHWLYLDRRVRGAMWYGWLKRFGYIGS